MSAPGSVAERECPLEDEDGGRSVDLRNTSWVGFAGREVENAPEAGRDSSVRSVIRLNRMRGSAGWGV